MRSDCYLLYMYMIFYYFMVLSFNDLIEVCSRCSKSGKLKLFAFYNENRRERNINLYLNSVSDDSE